MKRDRSVERPRGGQEERLGDELLSDQLPALSEGFSKTFRFAKRPIVVMDAGPDDLLRLFGLVDNQILDLTFAACLAFNGAADIAAVLVEIRDDLLEVRLREVGLPLFEMSCRPVKCEVGIWHQT